MAFTAKSPAEILDIGFDLRRIIATGLTISSATITITVEFGSALPSTLVKIGNAAIDGTNVLQRISQGVIGTTYILTVTATLSNGEVLTESSCISVIEKGC